MNSFSLIWRSGLWTGLASIALIVSLIWHLMSLQKNLTLIFLRILGVLALLAAALNPEIALNHSVFKKPGLLILIDRGHSMGGPAGKYNRLGAVQKWLLQNKNQIKSKAEASLFTLASNAKNLSSFKNLQTLSLSQADFSPQESLLAVKDQIQNLNPKRIWLFSDGNAPEEDFLAAAQSLKIPIDSIAVGRNIDKKGFLIRKIEAPDFAFLHGKFNFRVQIETQKLREIPCQLSLSKKTPGSSHWKILSQFQFTPSSNYESFNDTFTAIAEQLGSEKYRFKLEAAGISPLKREMAVPVIRQKYRIMYLAGRPSYEYSFLRRFIKKDPRRELVSFVILRNPQNPVFIPDNQLSLIPFPAQNIFLRDISQFDLFILENFSAQKFNLPAVYLESLANYVKKGGALLILGGPNAFSQGGYKNTPLEELLPVRLSAQIPDFISELFTPRPISWEHPLVNLYSDPNFSKTIWKNLPQLKGFGLFSALQPNSSPVLIDPNQKMPSGDPLPILAVRKFGQGRVMVISANSLWRWKLQNAEKAQGRNFYDRFWSRVIEYMTRTLSLSHVRFSPIPDEITPIEPAHFFFSVFDNDFSPIPAGKATISVKWIKPGRTQQTLTPQMIKPGSYEISLTGIPPGTNRIEAFAYRDSRLLGSDSISFDWNPEKNNSPVRRTILKKISSDSGGRFFEIKKTSARDLLSLLPQPKRRYQIKRRLRPFESPLWLALSALILILEWILRRKQGLP